MPDLKPYIIVYGLSLSLLEDDVNAYIKLGYIPVGGVEYKASGKTSGRYNHVEGEWYQAMILKPFMVFMAQ